MCRCAERRAAIKDAWTGQKSVLTSASFIATSIAQDTSDGVKAVAGKAQSALEKYLTRRGLK